MSIRPASPLSAPHPPSHSDQANASSASAPIASAHAAIASIDRHPVNLFDEDNGTAAVPIKSFKELFGEDKVDDAKPGPTPSATAPVMEPKSSANVNLSAPSEGPSKPQNSQLPTAKKVSIFTSVFNFFFGPRKVHPVEDINLDGGLSSISATKLSNQEKSDKCESLKGEYKHVQKQMEAPALTISTQKRAQAKVLERIAHCNFHTNHADISHGIENVPLPFYHEVKKRALEQGLKLYDEKGLGTLNRSDVRRIYKNHLGEVKKQLEGELAAITAKLNPAQATYNKLDNKRQQLAIAHHKIMGGHPPKDSVGSWYIQA